jgi:hypothetical protein
VVARGYSGAMVNKCGDRDGWTQDAARTLSRQESNRERSMTGEPRGLSQLGVDVIEWFVSSDALSSSHQ